MSAFDLVIFDCDGVLVDSELLSLAATRKALARAGLELGADVVRETYLAGAPRSSPPTPRTALVAGCRPTFSTGSDRTSSQLLGVD